MWVTINVSQNQIYTWKNYMMHQHKLITKELIIN